MISRRFIGEHKKYERLEEAEERADDLNTKSNSNNPKRKNLIAFTMTVNIIIIIIIIFSEILHPVPCKIKKRYVSCTRILNVFLKIISN
jgi:phage terminase Nu1 subunit (DNA packaging protein)